MRTTTRRALLCVCSSLLLPLFCSAQQNKLIVTPPDPVNVKRGSVASESLKVGILPGFHVNSDKPKDEFLIPFKLTWTGGPLETKSVTYPKAEEIKVGDQMLTVFTGDLDIRTEFKVPENAPTGPATMTGKLRYQACNNQMCFRPLSVEVHLPVVIE